MEQPRPDHSTHPTQNNKRRRTSRDTCQPSGEDRPCAAIHELSTSEHCQTALPDLEEVCRAPWTTIPFLPKALKHQWISIFTECLLQFTSCPTRSTYTKLVLASKLLLAAPKHGGRQRAEAVERMLRARLVEWHAGNIKPAWDAVKAGLVERPQRTSASGASTDNKRLESRVAALAEGGQASKACRLLCSRGISSTATGEQLSALFPPSSGIVLHPSSGLSPQTCLQIEKDALQKVILMCPRNTSPGPSGLRIDHIQNALSNSRATPAKRLLEALTSYVNISLSGTLPTELAAFMCAGRLIPLKKKDDSVRPLVICECLRALTAKAAISVAGKALSSQLLPLQQGLGGQRYGMQGAILAAQSWAARLEPGSAIFKVDLRNAFNSIRRDKCCIAVSTLEPRLAAWTQWTLCTPANIYVSRPNTVIPCGAGVQQGDPMSPFLFSAGLHDVIQRLQEQCPALQVWYLDDGLIHGKLHDIVLALSLLQSHLPTLGLELNLSKCELYTTDHTCPLPEPLQAIPRPAPSAWSFLGAPLSPQTIDCIASSKVRSDTVNSKLQQIATTHPLAALLLARASAGACRVNHIAASTDPNLISDSLLNPCGISLRGILGAISDADIPEDAWKQATLPQRLGGLGLRDPVSEATPARMATLLLAKTAALELGADENFVQAAIDRALLALQHELHGLPLTFGVRAKELQKQLTDLVHNQKLSDLRAHASHHDATRLASLSSPHALAWTTGPSPWFRLSPTDFRAGIRVVLGIPLGDSGYTCWDCMAPADARGFHAVRCTQSGAHSRGHYSVVNTIRDIAQYCGLSTMTEQAIPGTSPQVTSLRPADLLVSLEGKHLALDITVVSPPLIPIHMATSLTGPSRSNAQLHYMDAAAKAKTLKYSLPCSAARWTFSPVTCDTFGAMHSSARDLLQHLIRRLRAEDHPSWATSPGTAVWRSVSAAIISRAAQQYANAMAHYVSPTPASLLFDAQCAPEPPVRSSVTGTYTLAQPRPTTQPVGERVPLASPHSLRDFFGPDADGDIALDPTTLSTAAGPTPSSAPPNPHSGTSERLTHHGNQTMQLDGGDAPAPCPTRTAHLMTLPDGRVSPLVVSHAAHAAHLPEGNPAAPTHAYHGSHVASNADLGLRDPPGPISLLACERAGARVDLRF